MKTKAVYIGDDDALCNRLNKESNLIDANFTSNLLLPLTLKDEIGLIIFDINQRDEDSVKYVRFLSENINDTNIVLFIIGNSGLIQNYLMAGADDVFTTNTVISDIDRRFSFLKIHVTELRQNYKENLTVYKIERWKRIFDITFSILALLILFPLFLITALLIRIESKGSIFYASKRIGTGYKIFDFYKFRSMYTDADKRVDVFMKQNQYADDEECKEELDTNTGKSEDNPLLFCDENIYREQEYLQKKHKNQEASFFKLSNDPRITKIGRFIRNTSIDELPQLFNILKGDMSVVGNRPLPIYEAELLTSDRWIERFLAPAGLTGLWQVTKRGGANKMSADERKQLDIEYANTYSFWGDLKIIFRTIPALLQHENV
jgi:lipopolysaccharide/colanic/teichoic acid biosynthesis glycosyltransferase